MHSIMASSKVFPTDDQLQTLARNIGILIDQVASKLDISTEDVETIKHNHQGNTHTQNFQVLRKWRDKSHKNDKGRSDELRECMVALDKVNLARMVMGFYKEYTGVELQPDVQVSQDSLQPVNQLEASSALAVGFPTNAQLQTLGNLIGRAIGAIARHLGVSEAEVEMIEQNYINAQDRNFHILKIWRNNTPLNDKKRFDELHRCVKEAGKGEMHEKINEFYNDYIGADDKKVEVDKKPHNMMTPIREMKRDPEDQIPPDEGQMAVVEVNTTDARIKELLQDENVYPIKSNERGRAVIINNEKFTNGTTRAGTKIDGDKLKKLFQKLHFRVQVYNNKTAKEISKILEWENEHPDHEMADAFIFCILSHGGEGYVSGTDSGKIMIDGEICGAFDGNKCPHLVGKPKIFIIQACQGKNYGEARRGEARGDGSGYSEPKQQIYKHVKADMLVAYATITGDLAWRNPESGTWFIQTIVKVFAQRAHKDHIVELLTQVRAQLQTFSTDQEIHGGPKIVVQLSGNLDRLCKNFYFFPGYKPE